jgi:hypothetical protein
MRGVFVDKKRAILLSGFALSLLALSAPASAQRPVNSQGYPDLSGEWKEASNLVRIVQTGDKLIATCTYGNISWRMEGTITREGVVSGRLVHTAGVSPSSTGYAQDRRLTLSADGRVLEGQARFTGGGGHPLTWTRSSLSAQPSGPPPPASAPASGGVAALPGDFPASWQYESQGGVIATWTRRGTSNVFDALYREPSGRQATTVEELTIQGNQVRGRRISSSEGTLCNFTGTIQSDGRSMQGTGACPGVNSGWWWKLTAKTVVPPRVALSLTGPWVHSADANFKTDDSKVIVIQEANQVTIAHTWKYNGRWMVSVCRGALSGTTLQAQCSYAPGGNPFGFAAGAATWVVSQDGNHLDGTIGGGQESHYSRIP